VVDHYSEIYLIGSKKGNKMRNDVFIKIKCKLRYRILFLFTGLINKSLIDRDLYNNDIGNDHIKTLNDDINTINTKTPNKEKKEKIDIPFFDLGDDKNSTSNL